MKYMKEAISSWMKKEGPNSDVVLSSRVRLARNISDTPFPSNMDLDKAKEIMSRITKVWEDNIKGTDLFGEGEIININDLSKIDQKVLIEKHLISPALIDSKEGHSIFNDKESISIMINEEDHLRIQSFHPGFNLNQVWKNANELDDILEKTLPYAFSNKYGYLTACPTNVGTGLRASVMVHLPGLVMTKYMNNLVSAIQQVGLTVRGIYGEGSEALGNMYQVSNQVTLGQTEEEILDKLNDAVEQIIEHEQEARKKLSLSSSVALEDRIYRSYGTLLNCRMIETKEAMEKLSDLRLGIDLDFITDIPAIAVNELMVLIQPGYLQYNSEKDLDANKRDIYRSILIRNKLKDYFGGSTL